MQISHNDQLFLSLRVADTNFILSYSIVDEDFEPSTIQADLDPEAQAVFKAMGKLSVPGLRPLKCIFGERPGLNSHNLALFKSWPGNVEVRSLKGLGKLCTIEGEFDNAIPLGDTSGVVLVATKKGEV